MSANISSSARLRLVLASAGPTGRLAAGVLAQHLGVSPAAALVMIDEAPTVLAEAIDPEAALRLAGLLRSFGMRVRIDPAETRPEALDLSIQISLPVRMQRTIRLVAEETGLEAGAVAQGLQQPGGLVLSGLARADVARFTARLGRLGSLTLVESDPATAIYDVFLPDGDMTEALSDRLRMLGVEADPITGAVAAGLDRALCAHLQSRVTAPKLLVLDRAFQRYDMYLARAKGWVTQKLADFLVARTGLPRSRFEVLSESLPLQIERGLTYATARQFRADYASIGLQTLLVLAGQTQSADNSAH